MNAGQRQSPLGQFSGFLGNGDWMLAVHTRKCSRLRRRVVSSERVSSWVPNYNSDFAVAMRARADVAKVIGDAI